jgi:hypothetical protein
MKGNPMTVPISQESQKQIDRLRIDLAQVVVDLAEVQTQDFYSRQNKEKAIEGLRTIKQALDRLGILHSSQGRRAQDKA